MKMNNCILIIVCFLFLAGTVGAAGNTDTVTGSLPENNATNPTPVRPYTINDPNTSDISVVQPTILSQKENLTESERKLSSRLLSETSVSPGVSIQNQKVSGPGLLTKTLRTNDISTAQNTVQEKVSSGNLAYVYISLKPGYSTHIVDSLVADITDRDEDNHLVTGWVDIQNLLALAGLDGVRNIREVIPPVFNIGNVTTQGDAIHKTSDVRSTFGNNGAGIKIGIISDGVDHIADSVATGDLPENVHVLSNTVGGDEGTAMLEIVYDMVPEAELYFHDCGSNHLAFTQAVAELKEIGCTVICDDTGWPDVPYFEDGIIAKNITALISANPVIYVSSAGDSAETHYQGSFQSYPGYNWHDFSKGDDLSNPSVRLIIPPGSTVRIFLQWDDQFGHSGNDYDLYLSQISHGNGNLGSSENIQSGAGDPFETILYTNSGNSTITGYIDVFKLSGYTKTLELYIYSTDGTRADSSNLVAADSIFGHAAVPGVITVAAVPQSSPSTIEPFSSIGPVTIAYPSPVTRQKPDISGVDGVNITGAGKLPTTFNGTSASAPHIAAVVAQYWGAHPTLSPADVRSALYGSATDLGAAGKDTIFGYGRADALALEGFEVVATGGKIGVFRGPRNWYLDTSGNGAWGAGDSAYGFGLAGDLPITGKW